LRIVHLCQQNVKQLLDGIALADRRIAELQAAEAAKKAAEEKRRAEEDANQVKEVKKAAEEDKEIPVPPPRSKGDNVGDTNGAAIARFTYSPRPCSHWFAPMVLTERQAAAGWHCVGRPSHS